MHFHLEPVITDDQHDRNMIAKMEPNDMFSDVRYNEDKNKSVKGAEMFITAEVTRVLY